MITFEHTMPTVLIWCGIAVALAVCAFSFVRFVRINLHTLIIAVIRILFFALFLWCLFLPEIRKSETTMLKPRFIVTVDTSASMTLPKSEGVRNRWETTLEALQMDWTKFVQAECEMDIFAFSTNAGAKLNLNEALELEPTGSSTLLRDSLRSIASRYAGQNVAGMLVFSDGIDTREADDAWSSETWPFPVYTVRLEPEMIWDKEPDVRIDSVNTPRR
ncbi:MAG: hypothetical protein JXN60_09050, partial [Lentisphaerae bacterium]|nr:hypothetical protein [Lentisphaerota bacterium]